MSITNDQRRKYFGIWKEVMRTRGLDDEQRKDIMFEVAGVRSVRDLDHAGFERTINAFNAILKDRPDSGGGGADSAQDIASRRQATPRPVEGGSPYATPQTIAKIFERGAFLYELLHGIALKPVKVIWTKAQVRTLTGKDIDSITADQATSVLQSFSSRIGHARKKVEAGGR